MKTMRIKPPPKNDFPEFGGADFSAPGSPAGKLWGGIVAPVVLGLFGLYDIIMEKSFTFGLRYPKLKFEGTEAVYWGVATLFLAAFIHFYYWTVSEKLWKYSGLLKIIAVIGAVISFGLLFWTSFSEFM